MLAPHNIAAICRDLMLYRRHDVQISRDLTELEREWEEVLRKFERLAPADFRQVGGRARSNMDRYFAYLAYEAGSYRRALNRLKRGWRASPTRFLVDSRNWLTFTACMSGLLLPPDIHRRLEHLAGLHREGG
jgi:hypothetical protein